jgi:hypothetical protein
VAIERPTNAPNRQQNEGDIENPTESIALSPLQIYHDRVVSYLPSANYHAARGGILAELDCQNKTFFESFAAALSRLFVCGFCHCRVESKTGRIRRVVT